jgi:hypothetical protein
MNAFPFDDDTLMTLLPILLAGLLVGAGVAGALLPSSLRAWIVRWVFLPLYFFASAGMLAYLLLAPGAERSVLNFLVAGGGTTLAVWTFLRGRKAKAKSHPEMGTSV